MDGSSPDNLDEATSTSSALVEIIELLSPRSMRFLAHLLFCPGGPWATGGPSTVCSVSTDMFPWLMRPDPYKQDEYMALMDKFQEEKIPLAVTVVDMDW